MAEPVKKESAAEPRRCIGCKRTVDAALQSEAGECLRSINANPERCVRRRAAPPAVPGAGGSGPVSPADEIARLKALVADTMKRVSELEEQVNAKHGEVAALQGQLQTAKDEHRVQTASLSQDLGQAQAERDQALQEADAHMRTVEQQAQAHQSIVGNLKQELADALAAGDKPDDGARGGVAEPEQPVEDHQSIIEKLKQEVADAWAAQEKARSEVDDHKTALDQQATHHQSILEKLKQDVSDAWAAHEKARSEADDHKKALEQQAEQHQSILGKLKQEVTDAWAAHEKARSEADDHKKALEQQDKDHQSIVARLRQDLANAFSAHDKTLGEINVIKADAAKEIQALKSQLERAEKKISELSGGQTVVFPQEPQATAGLWDRLKMLVRDHRWIMAGTSGGGAVVGAIVSALIGGHSSEPASQAALNPHIDALIAAAQACLNDGQRSCALDAAQAAADDQASDPRVQELMRNKDIVEEKRWRENARVGGGQKPKETPG